MSQDDPRFPLRDPLPDDDDTEDESASRGYMVGDDGSLPGGEVAPWELLIIDSVGNAIEFWGFKRNQGRVWALLYLRGQPMSAAHIQTTLALSKGAVSMITRELEYWGIIHRVRQAHNPAWQFVAETDLIKMATRVLAEREGQVVARVKADLKEAERKARSIPSVPEDAIDRLIRMRMLASLFEQMLKKFLTTYQLDGSHLTGILKPPPSPPAPTPDSDDDDTP